MTTQLSCASGTRDLALDVKYDQLNGGTLRIYDGIPPADADTALSGNTLLAQLTFGSPAFAAASGGSKTANAITAETNAPAGGAATFWRGLTSAPASVVCQGTVGLTGSGESVELDDVVIPLGATVTVSSCVISEPA